MRYEDRGGELVARLGAITVNRIGAHEPAGYPTPCKGRFAARGRAQYLFEEPMSLNALRLLPELQAASVTALKIEGRQRGRAYVARAHGRTKDSCQYVCAEDPDGMMLAELLDGMPFSNGFFHGAEGWAQLATK